jgi:hypothetical protein
MSIDPRLRVLYLATVVVGVALLASPLAIAGVLATQLLAWRLVGLPTRLLVRHTLKLWGFALFLLASYALTADDPATDRWLAVALVGGWSIDVNVSGAATGALVVLRVVAVILASQVARAGDPRAVTQGLRRLGVPDVVAVAMDTVLALLGPEGRGGGGGGNGRGGGRGRGKGSFWQGLARLRRGDVGAIVHRLERQIDRAERHLEVQELGRRSRVWLRDVAVIAGISLTMLGIKAFKILPAIPLAPGHKLVVLTPLFVVAALLTRARLGATLTGLTMGSVAFLLGDGKYGVLEILKHVTPGLICDLCVPLLVAWRREPGRLAFALLGGLIAVGRFATIFAVVLFAQAPQVAYAILLPGLSVHVSFGILSGLVSFHLWRAVDRRRVTHPDEPSPAVALAAKESP